MLSTGDVQNFLRKLQTELRLIKFRDVDYKSLQTGNPCEFLKIYHYVFVDYNPLFAKALLDKCNCDFYGKTDSHFMDALYRALRDYFSYKPPITKEQFFTTGFAERKLQMCCDIISLVRQEYREIPLAQQPKRSGSASARDKQKRRIPSSSRRTDGSENNVFQPLRDMSLEENFFNEKHIEKWLDGSEHGNVVQNHRNPSEINNDPITALTIDRIEDQLQTLKIKVEQINARLENLSAIVEQTHGSSNGLSSSEISNFNARLVIVENDLAMLRGKTNVAAQQRSVPIETKAKSSFIPQGILIDSDEEAEERAMKSYAIEEPLQDFDIVERARSLLENAEQCNRDLVKTIQTKN